MAETQCFVIKRGTDFDKAVKKHFELKDKWNNMFSRVGELLGEVITEMVLDIENLMINPSEIKNENTKKLFTKDGSLKKNLKKSNELRKQYLEIIKEEGLEDFRDLRSINFTYGVMRFSGQSLKSFVTSEHDVYYEASFDLEARTNGLVESISEIEYQETYLNELKKKESERS